MSRMLILMVALGTGMHVVSGFADETRATWNPQTEQCEINGEPGYNTGWRPCSDQALGAGFKTENPDTFDGRPPADLSYQHLEHSFMEAVDLSSINARSAHFEGVNANGADLSNSDFRWANFSGARLNFSVLEGTDLRGAHLEGADLSFARFNDQTRFEGATFDRSTRLPFGWSPNDDEGTYGTAARRGMRFVQTR